MVKLSGTAALIGALYALASAVSVTRAETTPAAKMDTVTKSFSVKLGATRIIYNPDASGAMLAIINPQDYPILVQSKAYLEDRETSAPFIVTPPLFRIEAGQQSRVRVVRTGGSMAPDKETLFWLCVTGVPPKPDDVWGQDKDGKTRAPTTATLEVQLRVNNCIKLFVRPGSLKGDAADAASSVTWSRQGNTLRAVNPTPFYINLKELSVGSRKVESLEYIPPRGERRFPLPAGASGQVTWKVINDYGGDSRPFQSPLQ